MITCTNLSYQYPESNGFTLKNINFQIKNGEFVAILGANGSGKSTLAKHFNALLIPTSGECIVNNLSTLDEKNLFKIRSQVGMVFQNPDNQIVSGIVEEDVAFAPENLGISPSEIRTRVDDSLAAVNMESFSQHAPHLLSGGQKQRVAIAGILAMNPEIIIFDEPTAMLDPSGRKSVMEIIKNLHSEGKTIILITHNMSEVEVCDRLILMNDGKIVSDDTPSNTFAKIDLIHSCGLELSQIRRLEYNLSNCHSGLDPESHLLA